MKQPPDTCHSVQDDMANRRFSPGNRMGFRHGKHKIVLQERGDVNLTGYAPDKGHGVYDPDTRHFTLKPGMFLNTGGCFFLYII